MTGTIFQEYLYWFDDQMDGRKVLFLLDHFSAHELGLHLVQESNKQLKNTRIELLSACATIYHQPLEKGIINNLKIFYRKEWLEFMVSMTRQEKDPEAEITLLDALYWILHALESQVTAATIAYCWRKSRLLGAQDGPLIQPPGWNEERAALQALALQLGMKEAMYVDHIIVRPDEVIGDETGDILVHLAGIHSEVSVEEEEPTAAAPKEPISAARALQAIKGLISWKEQHGQGPEAFDLIIALRQEMMQLEAKVRSEKQHTLLDQSVLR